MARVPEERPERTEPIDHADLTDIALCIADARSAVDDLWRTAADGASNKPALSRRQRARRVHRQGYEVLQRLRDAEVSVSYLRTKIRGAGGAA